MVVRAGGAEVVDAAQVLLRALGHEVEEVLLVEGPLRATLGAGAVVAHHDDDRVVELAQLVDEVEHALHLGVGVGEEAGEDLHHPGVEALLVLGERVPLGHPRGALRQLRCPRGADPRPPGGRTPSRASASQPWSKCPRYGSMKDAGAWWGAWHAPGVNQRKKGLSGWDGAEVLEEQRRLVGQVLGEVVPLLRRRRRLDVVVVVDELGVVLVGLAAHEPVEALEPAPERPLVARAAHRHLGGGREVPLADRERGVPVADQDLREEAVLVRDGGVVAREARRELDDAGHAVRVVVAAGQQARARRRAQRGGVEVREAVPGAGQGVEARRGDVGAVAAELGVADVVEEHDDDVRRSLGRRRQRRPPSLGLGVGTPDDTLELRPRHAHGRIVSPLMPVRQRRGGWPAGPPRPARAPHRGTRR